MFFETFINTGILKAGDYLILDNAAIHPSSRIQELLPNPPNLFKDTAYIFT